MPVSMIDPVPALIIVDLQKGHVSAPLLHPIDEIVRHSAQLAAMFRAHDMPVVLVSVAGHAPGRTELGSGAPANPPPDYAEIVDQLDPAPTDHRVVKQRWGAFTGTDLHETLQARGDTQVVITGVATSIGVESTARSAHEHGYNVVLVTDAITDIDPDAHDRSTTYIFPRLGERAGTAEILALLS